MANEKNFQEKILTSSVTSVTFTGAPGPITISDAAGAFAGATVTQSFPGDTVAIDTFTAEDSFYFNGQDVTFGLSSATTEIISIKWFRNKTPY